MADFFYFNMIRVLGKRRDRISGCWVDDIINLLIGNIVALNPTYFFFYFNMIRVLGKRRDRISGCWVDDRINLLIGNILALNPTYFS
jgi:hypothetical protein